MPGSCTDALLSQSSCFLTISRRRGALLGAAAGVALLVLLRVLIIDTLVWSTSSTRSASNHWSGASQDSVELIKKISIDIKEPSTEPYNLTRPDTIDFSQNGQSCYIAGLFAPRKEGRTYLEAGAYNGEDLSNTLYLERSLGWSGLLVEPDPWSFWGLRRRNRRARLLQSCLSPTTTASMMTLKQSGEMSHLRKPEEVGQQGIYAVVPCYPLYAVMQAAGLAELDYLALDLEGVEMQVLQTLPWDSVNIAVVQVEASHLDPAKIGRNAPRRKSTQNFQQSLPLQLSSSHYAGRSRAVRSTDMTSKGLNVEPDMTTNCAGKSFNPSPKMEELSAGQRQLVTFMARNEYEFLTSIGEDFIFRKYSNTTKLT